MAGVEIDVADLQRQLQHLAATFKSSSPKLRRDMLKALRRTAEPIKADQQRVVGSGSLSGAIAQTVTIQVRGTGRYTGVNIRASGAKMPRRNMRKLPKYVDYGSWRHPVFPRGPRDDWHWAEQQSWQPGWFLQTGIRHHPAVVREIASTLDEFTRYLASRS